ncbi:Uncharacterised protein g4379 [Pycnogonum litorale]
MEILSMFGLCVALMVGIVEGHGRLRSPPSRSSMWRDGFSNPTNYQDNELFCGGFQRQYEVNNGACGICGDPADGTRENEAGGKYANGIITATYAPGAIIVTRIELTANHGGNFVFKICANNNVNTAATQQCLDAYPLNLAGQSTSVYPVNTSRTGDYYIRLQLPQGLTCSQCVLQWTYTAGNNWGVCADGVGRVGCGNQEMFRGCSDVAIVTGGATGTTPTTPTTLSNGNQPCRAIGAWTGIQAMNAWCNTNCNAGNCPSTHCSCTP